MDSTVKKSVDLTSNITEAELDRPGYLPTTVDCVKWAPDGRLAVNVGTIALVYQPRFEGRERYGYTAFSAPCPDGDSTIMDLQRFPGKAGDFAEFARKGLKYLASYDPNRIEKCIVGGDSSTISSIAWSSRGCAWDGGCLLTVVTSLHTVTVFQPARAPCGMEWEPLATVSKALVEWGLRTCPTDGARIYRNRLGLGEDKDDHSDTKGKGKGSSKGEDQSGSNNGDGRELDGEDGDGFFLSGLWAVAKTARTRAVAWMGRRAPHPQPERPEPAEAAPAPAAGGRSGSGVSSTGSGGAGAAGGGDFTLLAMAGDSVVTLWAFSENVGRGTGDSDGVEGGATVEDVEEEGDRSLGLVRRSPAWAGDLRAMGSGTRDGNVRALAWCHEPGGPVPASAPSPDPPSREDSPSPPSCNDSSPPVLDFLAIGTAAGAVLLLGVDIGGTGAKSGKRGTQGRRFGGGGGGGGGGDGDGSGREQTSGTGLGSGSSAGATAMVAVEAVPFRRICLPDGCPVTFLTFVTPGSRTELTGKKSDDGGEAPGWSLRRSALAVAKGASVSLYGAVTAAHAARPARSSADASPPTKAAAAAAAAATSQRLPPPAARQSFTAAPHRFQPTAVTWVAHDHNVTGISAVPFPGPVCSATGPASTPASGNAGTAPGKGPKNGGGPGSEKSGEAGGGSSTGGDGVAGGAGLDPSVASEGGGGGGGAGGAAVTGGVPAGGGRGPQRGAVDEGGSTALIYTSSMDGSCKEWEVRLSAAAEDEEVAERGGSDEGERRKGTGAEGVARLRKMVSGDARRSGFPSPSKLPPPLLGCGASPNGVLVAFLEFCRPERSSRKAVQHTARKGTHCRVVLTPMVPPAAERAVTAYKGGDASWKFPLALGALWTDWAWFLRAATLGNTAVLSNHEKVTSFALVPTLRRALEDAVLKAADACRLGDSPARAAAAAAAARPPASGATPAAKGGSAGASSVTGGVVGDSRSIRSVGRPSAGLWDLLRLHHVFLATAAGVAFCEATLHVPPVADNGDGGGNTDEEDEEEEEGEEDEEEEEEEEEEEDEEDGDGESGGDGSASDGDETERVTAGADAGAVAATKDKDRPTAGGGERSKEGQVGEESGDARPLLGTPPQPQPSAESPTLSSAPAPPPQQQQQPQKKIKSGTTPACTPRPPTKRPNLKYTPPSSRPKRRRNESARDKEAAAAAAKVKRMRRRRKAAERTSAAELAARASAAESAARTRLVLIGAWERLKLLSGGSGVGDSGYGGRGEVAAAAAQKAVAVRCLREACRLARARASAPSPLTLPSNPNATAPAAAPVAAPAAAAAAATVPGRKTSGRLVGGFLPGPLATPVVDLPCEVDVRAALLMLAGDGEGGENGLPPPPVVGSAATAAKGRPPASAPSPDDASCHLCGAPMLSEADAAAAAAAAATTGGAAAVPVITGAVADGGKPTAGVGGRAGSEAAGGREEEEAAGVQVPQLELPGWAVCRRGHRVRRCMDTLAPSVGLGYRRCEVCRCVRIPPAEGSSPPGVVEVGLGSGGGAFGAGGASSSSALEGSTCVFCNVLLATDGSAVCWRG